ncbi:MAG: type I 3-dehydroquinate dehydratase [Vicinamibacteraceae bacterium]
MGALIVEAVAAASPDAMREQRDASRADLVELRLDLMDRPDPQAAMAGRSRPVIVTCRAAWEGGRFQGSETERLAILSEALALGADYVDLEWKAAAALEQWPADVRARVVLSHHDFDGVPSDLADRVREMRRHGTAVVKIAATAKTLRDALPVIAIGRAGRDAGQRTVVIAMGMPGVATRVLPDHVGSCWTYGGNGVAPGQVSVDRLRDEFRVGRVTAATPVYAVVGRPIGHSVSPAMHNAAFAATGLDGVYLPCEAADFDDFLGLAEVLGIDGASVTAPFKEDAARTAGQSGALNTLRRRDGGWDGTNTDVEGFLAPLADVALQGRRAAIVGAGGSARSVVSGLLSRGARVSVHARRPEAAQALADTAQVTVGAWPVPRGSWDLLVNTTPVGTYPNVDRSPVDAGDLDGALVYDLVYNPRPTRLLRDAAAAGCRTLDGLDMLVAQATRQFAWWTGVTPEAGVLRGAAEARLAAMAPPALAGDARTEARTSV